MRAREKMILRARKRRKHRKMRQPSWTTFVTSSIMSVTNYRASGLMARYQSRVASYRKWASGRRGLRSVCNQVLLHRTTDERRPSHTTETGLICQRAPMTSFELRHRQLHLMLLCPPSSRHHFGLFDRRHPIAWISPICCWSSVVEQIILAHFPSPQISLRQTLYLTHSSQAFLQIFKNPRSALE